MRRSLFSARPASSLRQLVCQQPRRTFATPASNGPAPTQPSQEQAHPIGPFYESILRTPQGPSEKKPETPAATSASVPEPEPAAPAPTPAKRGRKPKAATAAPVLEDKAKSVTSFPEPSSSSSSSTADDSSNDVQARARLIFSSSLAGPVDRAERLASIRGHSRMLAGLLVPPKPEEPDNCCMSGCVNCVWDTYREEMEQWAAANAEAEGKLAAQETGVDVTEDSMTAKDEARSETHEVDDRGGVSMDDDGGGSGSNWAPDTPGKKISKDFWDEDLYKNVPVGIREFMKQEKRLKEKHSREGTTGG